MITTGSPAGTTPYSTSREHLLDEIALVRARALAIVGDKGSLAGAEAAPDPDLVARRVALGLAAGFDLRLPHVEATFDLTPIERAVLLTAAAAEFDPLFRSLCRGLQGELSGPTLQVGTILELVTRELGQAVDAALLFLPNGKLRANALIAVEDPLVPRDAPLQALKVRIPLGLALYLVGAEPTSAPAWMKLRPAAPRTVLARARIPKERKEELVAFLGAAWQERRQVLVEICGPEGCGKKYLAEGLCTELGWKLLVVDCRRMAHEGDLRPLGSRLGEVRREAMLSDAVPYLDHYDAILTRSAPQTREDEQHAASQQVAPTPTLAIPPELSELLGSLPMCFLGAGERFEKLGDAGRVLRVGVLFPSPAQRAAIWDQAFEGIPLAPDVDTTELGRKLALDAGRIHAAVAGSCGTAQLRTGTAALITRGDVLEASRHQLEHDLKSLAVRIDKAFRWEDLVISSEGYYSLLEMLSYARDAEKVYEKWGFGAKHNVSQGISALFSGPPGTGKTMCASIIARELDMELFRVDLSRVVSKWIGETEKNLARVFDEAQRSHAVVLFDEADSLFAKRTEVKSSVDRYANLEVNFLLQRMETFSGVTILTTNFEDTIDTAFKRRLTFRIRFEKPDAQARAALWAKMFPPAAELAPDVNFRELSKRFDISGGNIRNAAIRSAFLAAAEGHAIDRDTIVRATVKEAREMGVLIADNWVPSELDVEPDVEEREPLPPRPRPPALLSAEGPIVTDAPPPSVAAAPAPPPAKDPVPATLEPAPQEALPSLPKLPPGAVPITRRRKPGPPSSGV